MRGKSIDYILLIILALPIKVNAEIKDGLFATVGNMAITKSDIVDEIKTILILNNQSYSDERREELQNAADTHVLKHTTAFGYYDHNFVGLCQHLEELPNNGDTRSIQRI